MKTTTEPAADPTEPENPPEKKARNPILRFMGELPGLIIIAFVLALLIKSFLVQAFFIPSGSMEPTLKPGDRVLVVKVPYYLHDPRRGDIIVFSDPNSTGETKRGVVGGFFHWVVQGLGVTSPDNPDFIKRVIGLPGDTVWGKGGSVYVNGVKLTEPYLTQQTGDFQHFKVPPGDLFVMGDNRGNSLDSRYSLGYVPIDKVIGKADIIIWPPSRLGLLH